MSKRICFNFASRSRPKKFIECLNNIREMTDDKNYFVLAKIDIDQVGLYNVESITTHFPEVVVSIAPSMSKVHAINRGLVQYKDWDIICNHSDDMWFTKKGFDNIIREHCTEDSFIHIPDQVVGDKLCTYSIMDKVYFNRFNYIYHPHYKSLWCDNEATDVAKILGRYKFVPENILEHRHPANGAQWGVYDAQYRRNEGLYWTDKKTYDKRKQRNFYL